MQYRFVSVLPLLLVFLLPFVCTPKAEAIPAFTRQYKTECSTCHTIYPELNEYGQAFLKNGYVYTVEQESGKGGETPATSDKGEIAQKQAGQGNNREALLLAGIPEWLPLSL